MGFKGSEVQILSPRKPGFHSLGLRNNCPYQPQISCHNFDKQRVKMVKSMEGKLVDNYLYIFTFYYRSLLIVFL
jgi:hypothetical protein